MTDSPPPDTDHIDWDDPKQPTPTWERFEELQKQDSNLWWRIGCGHHENLYDSAVAVIEQLRADRDKWLAEARRIAVELGKATITIADHRETIARLTRNPGHE